MSADFSLGATPLHLNSPVLLADPGTAEIINGTPTNNFPEVGIVNGFCSGTLISPNHVLTAGHCTDGVGESNGSFRVNGTTYGTVEQIEHPQMNLNRLGTDSANDISVMVLNRDVVGVAPANILREAPNVGDLLTLVGFGAGGTGDTGHDGSFGTKRVGTTPIDNVSRTLIEWRFDNNSESNTAPGDSGGPAFVSINGEQFIAGVTSGGDRFDAGIGDNSFDTRVDAYKDFIDSIVGTTDPPPPPPTDQVIVDNQDATGFATTGQWRESGSIDEFQGSSLFNLNVGATATWTPSLEAGNYEVAVRWGAQRADGSAFPATLTHNTPSATTARPTTSPSIRTPPPANGSSWARWRSTVRAMNWSPSPVRPTDRAPPTLTPSGSPSPANYPPGSPSHPPTGWSPPRRVGKTPLMLCSIASRLLT